MEEQGRLPLNPKDVLINKATVVFDPKLNPDQIKDASFALINGVMAAENEIGTIADVIGEGDNKVLVFRQSVKQTENQTMAALPSKQFGTKRDMGTFDTSYQKVVFVNRHGIFELVFITNQQGKINPESPTFKEDTDTSPIQMQDWANQRENRLSQITPTALAALKKIIAAKHYAIAPPPRSTDTAYDALYEPPTNNTDINRWIWELSQKLDPNSITYKYQFLAPRRDTEVANTQNQPSQSFSPGFEGVAKVTDFATLLKVLPPLPSEAPQTAA